jgi:hypothetical protein
MFWIFVIFIFLVSNWFIFRKNEKIKPILVVILPTIIISIIIWFLLPKPNHVDRTEGIKESSKNSNIIKASNNTSISPEKTLPSTNTDDNAPSIVINPISKELLRLSKTKSVYLKIRPKSTLNLRKCPNHTCILIAQLAPNSTIKLTGLSNNVKNSNGLIVTWVEITTVKSQYCPSKSISKNLECLNWISEPTLRGWVNSNFLQ